MVTAGVGISGSRSAGSASGIGPGADSSGTDSSSAGEIASAAGGSFGAVAALAGCRSINSSSLSRRSSAAAAGWNTLPRGAARTGWDTTGSGYSTVSSGTIVVPRRALGDLICEVTGAARAGRRMESSRSSTVEALASLAGINACGFVLSTRAGGSSSGIESFASASARLISDSDSGDGSSAC